MKFLFFLVVESIEIVMESEPMGQSMFKHKQMKLSFFPFIKAMAPEDKLAVLIIMLGSFATFYIGSSTELKQRLGIHLRRGKLAYLRVGSKFVITSFSLEPRCSFVHSLIYEELRANFLKPFGCLRNSGLHPAFFSGIQLKDYFQSGVPFYSDSDC